MSCSESKEKERENKNLDKSKKEITLEELPKIVSQLEDTLTTIKGIADKFPYGAIKVAEKGRRCTHSPKLKFVANSFKSDIQAGDGIRPVLKLSFKAKGSWETESGTHYTQSKMETKDFIALYEKNAPRIEIKEFGQ